MKITKEELAARLNNRQYGDEITKEEENWAKENNLVVVFGYSDDNTEFRGAINDEVGCYCGGEVEINEKGIFYFDGDEHEVLVKYNVLEAAKGKSAKIIVNWDSNGYSWSYDTKIPHVTFKIFDEKEPYCLGIIFSLNDL